MNWLLEELFSSTKIAHCGGVLDKLGETARFAKEQEIGAYELVHAALRGERELRIVVIEQGELLHVKPEANEIAQELLLVEETDEKESERQVDALEVLATIVRQEETLVEVCKERAAVFAHEMNVLAARAQRARRRRRRRWRRVQVKLTQVGLIARQWQVSNRFSFHKI